MRLAKSVGMPKVRRVNFLYHDEGNSPVEFFRYVSRWMKHVGSIGTSDDRLKSLALIRVMILL